MNILKFFAYIFYRFKNYYELWQAFIVFNAILMFNIISIFALYTSVMHYSSQDVWYLHYTNDYFYDRLVLGVAKVSPIFLTTYLISILFKKKISGYYIEFKNETKERQKKRIIGMWAYIVFTVLFFVFSIFSPLLF
jgi:hypothetical protein